MNNTRRKQIQNIINKLLDIKNEIDDLVIDEEDCLDNIPENMQDSERYKKSEVALENLSNASDTVEEVIEYLEGGAE